MKNKGIPLLCLAACISTAFVRVAPLAGAHGGGGGGFAARGAGISGFGPGHAFNAFGAQASLNHQNIGNWGAWARPSHFNSLYSLYVGWNYPIQTINVISTVTPMYFNTANMALPEYLKTPDPAKLTVNEVYAQLLNKGGTLPPARKYCEPGSDEQLSIFRLGPDTDILPSGKVAIDLSNRAYLLLSTDGTEVRERDTGKAILTLSTDPSLLWHIRSEIKRMSELLQKVVDSHKLKPIEEDKEDKKSAQDEADAAELESAMVNKINSVIKVLAKADSLLGTKPLEERPEPTPPPVSKAIEILASVWLVPHGDFIVMKLNDGSLAYMNGEKLYSDEGQTELSLPYPAAFRAAISSYLSGLIAQSGTTRRGLFQDWQYSTALKMSLQDKLRAQRKLVDTTQIASSQVAQSSDPRLAKFKKIQDDLNRVENRIKTINRQLDEMPKEVSASRKLLTDWNDAGR